MDYDNKVRVWDLGIRMFHWSLVVFFVIAYASGEGDETLHAYAGYIVLGLILFRLVWGFVGTKHARFSDFIRGPKKTLQYIHNFSSGKPGHYLGHNPLGGWMAVALILSISGASLSGIALYAVEGRGPLAKYSELFANSVSVVDNKSSRSEKIQSMRDKEAEDYWENIHETLANFTLLLVLLHVAGVFFASKVHNEKLIKAMVTGYKYLKEPY